MLVHPDPQQLQRMANNLINLQHHLAQPSPTSSPTQHNSPTRSNTLNIVDQLQQIYTQYLSTTDLPSNHEQKITYLLDQPSSPANAMALLEMLYYFQEALHPSILTELQTKTLQALTNTTLTTHQHAYLELLAQCPLPNETICQAATEILLTNSNLFAPAFQLLSNQGTTGLAYLLDLAARELPDLSLSILDHLARTEAVVLAVVVPALLQDVLDPSIGKQRLVALAALNRLAPLLSDPDILDLLLSLLGDHQLDPHMLLDTIRRAGLAGEQAILSLLHNNNLKQHLRAVALSTLSLKVGPATTVRVKCIDYDPMHLPGRLYHYQGTLQPQQPQEPYCADALCLNARDLLSQLQLLLRKEVPYPPKHCNHNNRQLSLLLPALQLYQQHDPPRALPETLDTLIQHLRHTAAPIRETALLQLGNLGHEAALSLEHVSNLLQDQESAVRSAACWTLSRVALPGATPRKLEQLLLPLLKDSFWKVRTSACMALGLTTPHPHPTTITALQKALFDASLPKAVVCEALARMQEQQLLLEYLKNPSSSYQLKEAALAALQEVPNDCPCLSQIVEQLLRQARNPRPESRELALTTLTKLQGHNPEALSQKQLLAFYYCLLDDPVARIRSLAAQQLLELGSQAELLFIEGLTRGSLQVKVQCLSCLGKLGVQNFRAVVLGLRDHNAKVRRAAADTIVESFSVQEVVLEFGRRGQGLSLSCSLKQVMRGVMPKGRVREMLQRIVMGLGGVLGKGDRLQQQSDENVWRNS